MKVQISQTNLTEFSADTLIVNLFDDVKTPSGATGAVDKALDGAISELIANGDATGKAGEVRVLYPRGALPYQRVLVAGLGKRAGFDLLGVRNAAAHAIQAAQQYKAQHVATIVHGAGVGGLDVAAATQATVEGTLLGDHVYEKQLQKPQERHEIEQLTLVESDEQKIAAMEQGTTAAHAVVAGVKLARDLVFGPPNIVTPEHMANVAQQIADEFGLAITIGDRDFMREHKMGALLAVAQAAGFDPRFIVLEHNADKKDLPTIALVGKGITFDTGGLSLKSRDGMILMKCDMGGAAAVMGAMRTVAELDLPLHVVGIMPCTENTVDALGYRPSDIITASNGKTIEIISTDAEGRMALADALVYAQRYDPDVVIDLATLTGAAVTALGSGVAAALFSNDDDLRDRLTSAGNATHERVWPMPLYDEYRKTIESPVADMINSGGAGNGVGTAAVFLEAFTDYTWAHLDIAGMALTNKKHAQAYQKHDATGFGVRLLTAYLQGINA